MLYLLEEVVFHVKELCQIEYLTDSLGRGEASEVCHEVEVVEEGEALLQIVLIETHSHFLGRERMALLEVMA